MKQPRRSGVYRTLAQRIGDMMGARKQHLQFMRRDFPNYKPGMSTRQYISEYWGMNNGFACPFKMTDFMFLGKE